MDEEGLEPVTDFKPEMVKVEPELFDYGDGDDDNCGDLEFKIEQDENEGTGSDNDYSEDFPVIRRTARIELSNRRKRNAKAKKSEEGGKKVSTYRKKRVSELTPEEQEKRRARWREEAKLKKTCYSKKRVSELTPEQQEKRRARWKEEARLKRERQKDVKETGLDSESDDAYQSEDPPVELKTTRIELKKRNAKAVSEGGGKKSTRRKKRVSELTPEEQEKRRARWKEDARRKRERQRQLKLESKAETEKKPCKRKTSEISPGEEREGKMKTSSEVTEESEERRGKRKREYYKRMAELGLKQKKIADLPPEEQERRRILNRERYRRRKELGRWIPKWGVPYKALTQLTPEQLEQKREEKLQRGRMYHYMRRANMTEEQLKEERMKGYIAYLTRKARMTPEEWEKKRARKRELKNGGKESRMTPEEREQYRERLRIRREKMRLRKEGLLPPRKKKKPFPGHPKVPKPKPPKLPKIKKKPKLKTGLRTEGLTPEQVARERHKLHLRINTAKFSLRRKLLAQGASDEVIAAEVQRLIEKYWTPPDPEEEPEEEEVLTPEEQQERERFLQRRRFLDAKSRLKKKLVAAGASKEIIAAEEKRLAEKYGTTPVPEREPKEVEILTPEGQQERERDLRRKRFWDAKFKLKRKLVGAGASEEVIAAEIQKLAEKYQVPFPESKILPRPEPVREVPLSSSSEVSQKTEAVQSIAHHHAVFEGAPYHNRLACQKTEEEAAQSIAVNNHVQLFGGASYHDHLGPTKVGHLDESCLSFDDDPSPVQSPPPSPCSPEPEPEWIPPVSTPTSDADTANMPRPKRGRPKKGEIRVPLPPPPKTRERVSHRTNPDAFSEICDECGNRYTRKTFLDKHKVMVHTGDFKDGTCTSCGEQFETPSRFYDHWYKTHRIRETRRRSRKVKVELEKELICEDCGTSFSNEANLRRHKYYEHGPGNLPENWRSCHLCPKTFKQKEALNYHLMSAHGLLQHRCRHCPQSFAKLSMLHHHMKDEHPDNVWTCKFCGIVKNTEVGVNFHIASKKCGKMGMEEITKWKRENMSFEREACKCELCQVEVQCIHLEYHYRCTHGVEKEDPFNCVSCGKEFARRDYYGVHLVDVHGYDVAESLKKISVLNVDTSKVKVMNLSGRFRGVQMEKREIEEDGDGDDGAIKKKNKMKRRKIVKGLEAGGEEGEDVGEYQRRIRGEESSDDYKTGMSSRYKTRGIRKTYKEEDDDDSDEEEEDKVEVKRTRRTNFQSDPKLTLNPVVMLVNCDKLIKLKSEV